MGCVKMINMKKLIGVAILAVALVLTTIGILINFLGYNRGVAVGETKQELVHVQETVKVQKKVKKTYEKIDRKTPYSSAKSERIDWLFDNARSDNN